MPTYLTPNPIIGTTRGSLVARNLQPASGDVARSLAGRTNTLIAHQSRTLFSACDYYSGEGITTATTKWSFTGPPLRHYIQRLRARWILAAPYSATDVPSATLYTRKDGDVGYYAHPAVTAAGLEDGAPPYAPSEYSVTTQLLTKINAAGDLAACTWDGYITVANGMQVIAFSLEEMPLETVSKTDAVMPGAAMPGMPIRLSTIAGVQARIATLWGDGPAIAWWAKAGGVELSSLTDVNVTGDSGAAAYAGPGSRMLAMDWEKYGLATVPISVWISARETVDKSGAELHWTLKQTTAAGATTTVASGTFAPGSSTPTIQRTDVTTWDPPGVACNYQMFVHAADANHLHVLGWGAYTTA
jgi:hypothetical protein